MGLPPKRIVDAIAKAGLQFNYGSGTGVVLHMLSCWQLMAGFGLTAIGNSPAHGAALFEAAKKADDAFLISGQCLVRSELAR